MDLLSFGLICITLVAGTNAQVTLAEIGETISNDSVLIGDNAFFFCEVLGEQGIGESLTFSKIDTGDAFVISVDSDVIEPEKYEIRDKYELKIKDTTIDDVGTYECSFAAQDYVAYLTVSDPPSSADIYWNDGDSWTPKDRVGNLTCSASKSFPPASFRWYRGSTSLTRDAIRVTEEDNEGYGKAWSYLEMEPSSTDEGDVITCYVDMPHKNAYFTETISIQFSGSSPLAVCVSTLLMTLAATLLKL